MDEFEIAYREGAPPWDIGRPQPALVDVERRGELGRRVLDVGCGTGELVLHMASTGHEAWGLDGSKTAIDRARAKAKARGIPAKFVVHDALRLAELGQRFDAVTDSGLFHVFSDAERPRFARSVHAVLRAGGLYVMLCFSEHEPGDWGPRRVTQDEIRAAFGHGFEAESIVAARFDTNLGADGIAAWLARIRRA